MGGPPRREQSEPMDIFQTNFMLEYRPQIFAVFGLLIIIEIVWNRRGGKGVYNFKETAANFFMYGVLLASKVVLGLYQIWILTLTYDHRLFTIESNLISFLIVFALAEFTYYWQHRLMHESRPFWAIHLVHHSSPFMNLSTSLRLPWLDPIVQPLFHLPMIWLGFHPLLVGSAVLLNLFYQYWLHTEMVPRLGPVEGWLNTPSAHRVHHASNEIYIDKNYGGVTMIFDRLFGTYQPETEAVRYGVTTGFQGHNPFTIQVIGLWDLLRGKFNYKG
jgi:sterol desaturase/sphingolipid hydroxylase (fatty acid hydroxylase superfamily)